MSRKPLGTPSLASAAAASLKWREDLEKSDKRGGTERRLRLKAADESLSIVLLLSASFLQLDAVLRSSSATETLLSRPLASLGHAHCKIIPLLFIGQFL